MRISGQQINFGAVGFDGWFKIRSGRMIQFEKYQTEFHRTIATKTRGVVVNEIKNGEFFHINRYITSYRKVEGENHVLYLRIIEQNKR